MEDNATSPKIKIAIQLPKNLAELTDTASSQLQQSTLGADLLKVFAQIAKDLEPLITITISTNAQSQQSSDNT